MISTLLLKKMEEKGNKKLYRKEMCQNSSEPENEIPSPNSFIVCYTLQLFLHAYFVYYAAYVSVTFIIVYIENLLFSRQQQ